jgi:predicted transcriptional regulator
MKNKMNPFTAKSILKSLPQKRQNNIKARAKTYIQEYKSLQELRKSLGFTQNEVAEMQGVRQVNISNLEKRDDMHISTLRKYVKALGCELEINIRINNETIARIEIL